MYFGLIKEKIQQLAIENEIIVNQFSDFAKH